MAITESGGVYLNHVAVSSSANLPTTLRCEGDLMMKVVEQSQHKHEQIERPMIATPWQQYRADDEQPLTIAFCYVVVLLSRQNKEIWICDITSSSPNELIVNDGVYRMIVNVYPRRGSVIGNSAVDNKGNQLPSHARSFTIVLPVDVPMIYNATLQLIKEDDAVLCHEIALNIRINLPEAGSFCSYQNGDLLEVEYPRPRIKLTGVLRYQFSWNIIMHFENLADNGQFELYRRHRKIIENWAKTRPQYQDLVAVILLEEGVASLIKHRIEEGINLARRACRLSSYYSCVNDRAIRGYASAVYAAAERFGGNQDGAKEQLTDALEVRFPVIISF